MTIPARTPSSHARLQGLAVALGALLLAAGASAPLTAAESEIPLKNADFEGGDRSTGTNPKVTGNVANGWSDNSDWADVKVEYAQDGDKPHGGKAAQRITVSKVGGGAVQMVQTVSLKKGKSYSFSAWLKGKPGAQVGLFLRRVDPYTYYGTTKASVTEDWKQHKVDATVTEDADVLVMIVLESPADIVIDDVRLVER
ncbi:MAG: carbohydrate binding domain-containing protein [Planctomycetes bacterium]|nr:carbohydrate binding domain-containing protein [Planctomycetota bacterium]